MAGTTGNWWQKGGENKAGLAILGPASEAGKPQIKMVVGVGSGQSKNFLTWLIGHNLLKLMEFQLSSKISITRSR